jgi:nitroreductase
MPVPNQAALDFLLTRRSRPAKTLRAPVPDRATLDILLTAAARTPDHGKLEPWRFIVLGKPALTRLAGMIPERAAALDIAPDKLEKSISQYRDSDLAIVVVDSPVASDKVPRVEQTYSAGAVCLSLLNATLAAGWGANWLSGWASHDRVFCEDGIGLAPDERIAGLIHIGTETNAPPERPRPDLAQKVTWINA